MNDERPANEVRLRRLDEHDANELAAAADDPEVARYLSPGFPQPYQRSDAIRLIASQRLLETPLQFASSSQQRPDRGRS